MIKRKLKQREKIDTVPALRSLILSSKGDSQIFKSHPQDTQIQNKHHGTHKYLS